MAGAWFNGFDVAVLDDDGLVVPLASETFNVVALPLGGSLGTVTSDGQGHVSDGSLITTVGTVVRFTHPDYPDASFTRTIGGSVAAAAALVGNYGPGWVLEDTTVDHREFDTGEVWAVDLDNVNAKDTFLGYGIVGETNYFPFESIIGRNFRLHLNPIGANGERKYRQHTDAPYADLSAASLAAGPDETVSRAFFDHILDRPNSAGRTAIYIDQVDAGRLALAGDKIKAEYELTTAANTNEKRVWVSFAGTDLLDTGGGVTLGNDDDCKIYVTLRRVINTSVKCSVVMHVNGANPFIRNVTLSALNLTTTDYDLGVDAQGEDPDDVTGLGGDGEFSPATVTGTDVGVITYLGEIVTYGGDEITV